LQSNRLDTYQKHVQQLLEKGAAYYCYCSEQRLEDLRKEQIALKKPPMYDRHCRNLSSEQREVLLTACLEEGRKPVVRMVIPDGGKTVVHDTIYGDITYDHSVLDDQIILKSDGFPTYHLAVVVDDHLMQITHVLRGEEWLPSTPKHILLYQAFGWEPTQFAHMPLILNTQKAKLSKRHDDVAVEDFLKKGYLKEALINFVSLLGWNPKTEQEVFSMGQLIAEFDLAKINKSGAVFDIAKLDWLNSQYIRQLTDADLVKYLIPHWQAAGLLTSQAQAYRAGGLELPITIDFLEAVAGLEKERLKKLSEIGDRTSYFFKRPTYNNELLTWKKSTAADAKEKLSLLETLFSSTPEETLANKTPLEELVTGFIKENGYETGNVLWPLRVALTGMPASPGPFEVASVLAKGYGRNEIVSRLRIAKDSIV
jgi:glutamyl-tRNA synthetase